MGIGTSFLIGITLLASAKPMQHYEILHSGPEKVVIKFNPYEFQPRLVRSKYALDEKAKVELAFNTNYYHGTKPIGFLVADGKQILPPKVHPTKTGALRPIFTITDGKATIEPASPKKFTGQFDFAFEGGPAIITGGVTSDRILRLEREIGKWQGDVFESTKHLIVGLQKSGKVVVAYYNKATLAEAAQDLLKYKVHTAMNFDGGKSARLKFVDREAGKVIAVGNVIAGFPVGVKFTL